MDVRGGEEPIHRGALFREALAARLEGAAQDALADLGVRAHFSWIILTVTEPCPE
jgi:hypothetical protein